MIMHVIYSESKNQFKVLNSWNVLSLKWKHINSFMKRKWMYLFVYKHMNTCTCTHPLQGNYNMFLCLYNEWCVKRLWTFTINIRFWKRRKYIDAWSNIYLYTCTTAGLKILQPFPHAIITIFYNQKWKC